MKKLIVILAALVLAPAFAWGQSHEPFTGATARIDSPQVQKWIRPGGMFSNGATWKRDGNTGQPTYYNDSTGFTGYVLWDSATGTSGEMRLVNVQKSGTNNTKELMIVRDDNSTFASGGGIVAMHVPQSGTDQFTMRYYNQWGGTAGSTLGYPQVAVGHPEATTINSEFAIGDTMFMRYWPDGRWTAGIIHVGGAVDSVTWLTSQFTGSALTVITNCAGSGARFGIGSFVRSTANKIDDVRIDAPGASSPPPPPPGGDTTPPVIAGFAPSRAQYILNSTPLPYLSCTISDNKGLANSVWDSSANGVSGWVNFANANHPGAPTNIVVQFPTLYRNYAGTQYYRITVYDTAGNSTVSNVVSVQFIDTTGQSDQKTIRTYADLIMGNVNIPGHQSGGDINLADMNFAPFDNVSLFNFYPNGLNSYATDNGPVDAMKHIVTEIHAQGSSATACIGVNNTRFRSWIFPNITASVGYLMSYFIDSLKFDGFEIDCEPYSSTDSLSLRLFLQELRDSLNTRTSAYSWTGKPLLTIDAMTGSYTSGTWDFHKRIQQYVDIVNFMTYDKMGNWTGFLSHESAIRSYPDKNVAWNNGWWNACDYGATYNGCPNMFPSLETTIKICQSKGYDMSKLGVGIDYHARGHRGGTYLDPDGPLHPRSVFTAAANWGGEFLTGPNYGMAEWKWWAFNRDYLKVYPDSVHWDDSSKSYYMSLDFPGSANDEYISFAGGPGLDSMTKAAIDLVYEYKIGGLLIWSLGETVPLDAGADKNWQATQFAKYTAPRFDSLPIAPTLTDPDDDEVVGPNKVFVVSTKTLRWAPVPTADKYWLQISAQSNFKGLLVNDSTIVTNEYTISPGQLNANTKYYWRVAAINEVGIGSFSAVRSFIVYPDLPGIVTNNAPANGSAAVVANPDFTFTVPYTGTPPATAIANRVDTVQLEISTTSNFSAVVARDTFRVTTVQSTFPSPITLNAATLYYWRLRAKNVTGWGEWNSLTGAWSFTVEGLPNLGLPTILNPPVGVGSIDTVNVQLKWNPVPTATKYRVVVSTLSNFATLIKDTVTSLTQYYVPDLSASDTVWWKVQAQRAAVGDTGKFTTGWFVTTIPFIFPEGGEMIVVPWWDPVRKVWIFNQPVPYLAMMDLPISSYPKPNAAQIRTFGARGQKTYTGDSISAAGYTGAAMADSLAGHTIRGLRAEDPTFFGDVDFRGTDTNIVGTIHPPQLNTSVNFAKTPGDMVVHPFQTLSLIQLNTTNLNVTGSAGMSNLTLSGALTGFVFTAPYAGVGLRLDNYGSIYPYTNLYTDIGTQYTKFKDAWINRAYLDSLYVNGTKITAGGGTNLGDTTPDSVKASIYMDDSAKVNISNAVGTYLGYYGIEPSLGEAGVWAKAASASTPVWLGALTDGSGIRITAQSGTVVKQYTADERSHRIVKGYANSDPVSDTWQFKRTTTDATPTVASYVRFDSTAGSNEDYAGYNNRPGSYIVYVDVVGARTDVDGYLMYSRRCLIDNTAAGAVTLRTTDTIGTDQAGGTGGIAIAIGGTNSDALQVTVTGATSQTWQWAITYRVIGIGN